MSVSHEEMDAYRDLAHLTEQQHRYQRYWHAKQPKRAADVMSKVMQKRGYGRILESDQLQQRWDDCLQEPLQSLTRATRIVRRVLEVIVANSVALQELTFQKEALLQAFNEKDSTNSVRDIRFRIGTVQRSSQANK